MLQGYSHQESMILAENQKYRPMGQDRKPRTHTQKMHLWVPYFFDKGGNNIQWGKDSLSIIMPGKLGSYL